MTTTNVYAFTATFEIFLSGRVIAVGVKTMLF